MFEIRPLGAAGRLINRLAAVARLAKVARLGEAARLADVARRALVPVVAEVRRRTAGDPAAQSGPALAMPAVAGVNPLGGLAPGLAPGHAGGLAPGLAQAPFFIILYRLFLSSAPGGEPGAQPAQALWAPQPGAAWSGGGLFGPHDWMFLAVFAALGAGAWWSARRLRGAPEPVLRLLPYASVLLAAAVPLAAALCLVTATAWTTMENAVLRRVARPGSGGRGATGPPAGLTPA